ncbi:hypothetical protein JA1_005091 [Spathaspora sp. JA1]|nr:hypothetical protein JA1_005091 [Spathaspora sp. JA1]
MSTSNNNQSWNTLYDYTNGKIYIHLKNNDLLGLNFSLAGFQGDQINTLNLKNNQVIETLPSPPDKSTLFLLQGKLYALTSSASKSGRDLCGDGILSIVEFSNNNWNKVINLNYDNIKDASFYRFPTILTDPSYNNTIYFYGGLCEQSNSISNRLLSLEIDSQKLSTILTSITPQAFYGAGNLLAPTTQSQLVIGGQSSSGWLNMYQLATWNFEAGWSFEQVSKSNTMINSRKFPLLLPLFNPMGNISSIQDSFKLNQVLLIGGESGAGQATPAFAKLALDSNKWYWNSTMETNEIAYGDISGAATIFNTLVVVNSTNTNKKRDVSQYHINLFDTNTFQPVSSLKENTQVIQTSNTVPSSSSPTNTAKPSSSDNSSFEKKVVMGTVFPVVFISIVIGIVAFFMIKRRRRNQEARYNDLDYKFGYLQQDSIIGESGLSNMSDSNSTLDSASINSWMVKRQEYDKRMRHSYLASNETLNTADEELLIERNHVETVYDEDDNSDDIDNEKSFGTLKAPQPAITNKSVKKLNKTFSFSKSPPSSPNFKRKNVNKLQSLRLTNSEQLVKGQMGYNSLENSPTRFATDEDFDDISLDDTVDAQVLVSSKRRSILRVVNPDKEDQESKISKPESIREDFSQTIHNQFEKIAENASLRQRVPSGQPDLD